MPFTWNDSYQQQPRNQVSLKHRGKIIMGSLNNFCVECKLRQEMYKRDVRESRLHALLLGLICLDILAILLFVLGR